MSEEDWPPPIKSEDTTAGVALREYARVTSDDPGEAAAYARVMARVERSPARPRWWLAAAFGATVAAGLLWILRPGTTAIPSPPGPPPPMVAKATASPPAAAPELLLTAAPTALPAGRVLLAGGVVATLAAGTQATGRLAEGTLDLALSAGSLALEVPPRQPGQAVLLTAGGLRFTIVGTVLSLRRQGQRVELDVTSGLVAVSQEGDHVATVASGESWSAALPPANPPAPDRRPRIARRPSPQGCERIPMTRWQDRLACYRQEAQKGGPAGEHAQHLLARYLRDDVVDLTAALDAFEAQRARFPRGELRADADRAIIELLPLLGRHAEALVETQSFLDARPDARDRAEIRLMRGDIYRTIFGDLLRAEREYIEGTSGRGRTGDDSRFLRALCLEALGRLDDARDAYADYLAQAEPAHAREARRRMDRLAR
jgi:hypothetical protein